MPQPAKVLAPRHFRDLCRRARRGRYVLRNQLIVLLSFKAGLRACEIAGLEWGMVLTPSGKIAASITVANWIAKNGKGRRIPVHPELRNAHDQHHRASGGPRNGPIVQSQRGTHMTPRGIVNPTPTTSACCGDHMV